MVHCVEVKKQLMGVGWFSSSTMLGPDIEHNLSGFMENPFSQILTIEFQILMSCNSIDSCRCYSIEVTEVNKILLGTLSL